MILVCVSVFACVFLFLLGGMCFLVMHLCFLSFSREMLKCQNGFPAGGGGIRFLCDGNGNVLFAPVFCSNLSERTV